MSSENPGIAPLDPLTLIGQVRLNIGDTDYVALVTPVDGQGSYSYFSDSELAALLAAGSDSIARATGLAYRRLASVAAMTSSLIKTDDLTLDTTKRVSALLEIAQGWLDTAADEDAAAAAAAADIFLVAGYTPRSTNLSFVR